MLILLIKRHPGYGTTFGSFDYRALNATLNAT
jgi:hypothetical protein